jgi:AcrR family transcriptional regulator
MTKPTRTTPRRRLTAQARRELILAVAARLFAERGYDGASIDAIAAAAGVTAPVVYDHFASKRDLYRTLLEVHTAALVEATTQPVEGGTVEELLRTNVEAFFAFVEERPDAWRILFRDPSPDPEVAAVQRAVQAQATRRIAEAIVAPIARLSLSVRAPRAVANEVLAELGKSALNGLAGWWWEHREVPRATLVALAMDLLWVGLRDLAEE